MRRPGGTTESRLDGDERRLSTLEAFCDPLSISQLNRVELAKGWRCLEIGAGRGSIARWLAAQCPDGFVTATDTDIEHFANPGIPNLRIYRHDVVDGPTMPEDSFDLAHVRALLAHLPDRHAVLRRVLSWLAPGGWLVVEEPILVPANSRRTRACTGAGGFRATDGRPARQRLSLGLAPSRRTLRRRVREVKPTMFPVFAGMSSEVNQFWRINLTELGPDLIDAGLVDRSALASALMTLDDPDHIDLIMAFVCVSCRRPAGDVTVTSTGDP